jgi:hypothetical protein
MGDGRHACPKIGPERSRLGQNPKISPKRVRSVGTVEVSVLQAERVACGIMFYLTLGVGY